MDLPGFGIPEKLASRMSMAEQHDLRAPHLGKATEVNALTSLG
ncbi:hypothetical protein [Streptomyces sp. A1136]|nr:hypothetical protein [Streptomyces sp. A1136]